MSFVLRVGPTSLSLMVSVCSPGVETAHGLAGLWWLTVRSAKDFEDFVIRRSVDRYSTRPVLKHGPRSLTCMQADGS